MTTFLPGGAELEDRYETRVDIGQAASLEDLGQPLVDKLAEAISEGREIVSVSHSVDPAATDVDKSHSFLLVSRRMP